MPNPSFEDTVYCPIGTNDFQALSNWYNPTGSSPDYYNACANNGGGVPLNDWGFQYAEEGNAYVGIIPFWNELENYREYIQVELKTKLQKGKQYCWSFWISLLDSIDYASNNISISLTQSPPLNTGSQNLLNLTIYGKTDSVILDNINWTKIEGSFVAAGDEKYLTIGNFLENNLTSFTKLRDNSIGGPGSYYFLDNVFLGTCKSNIISPNIFTPNSDGINDVLIFESIGMELKNLSIINRWGNVIYNSSDIKWDGTHNQQNCSEGIYFYILNFFNIDKNKEEQITGFFQLIR